MGQNKTRLRVFAAVLLLLALLLSGCKPATFPATEESSGPETTEPAAETEPEQFDDGDMDPENAERDAGDGANVSVTDLQDVAGRTDGIDVSKWQGKIDWAQVAESGIDFAFIRIGYRGGNGVIYKDDYADYNLQQADKAGILLGVYFFSGAKTAEEAKEEAEWTIQAIAGYPISYPVVFDCEGFRSANSRMHGLSAAARTENALAYLDTVSAAGYAAMLYAPRNDLADTASWDVPKIAATYRIWVAQYSAVPYPEKDQPDYSGRTDAWQYTDKGSVPGIDGNVDLAVCYFTCAHAAAKDPSAAPGAAAIPPSAEDLLYSAVDEQVTAKTLTNLRVRATTKSEIAATLKNGDVATRVGIGSNGWSKLLYGGQTVYAITSYLTTDLSSGPQIEEKDVVAGNTFTPQNDSVTAKELVNLLALPTTEGAIVGSLSAGQFLQRTAVSDLGWSRLVYNGQTVYAITSYLTTETPAQTGEAPRDDGFAATDEQVTAKSETNLRTAPSTTGSEVVYTLKNGEYVRRVGIHNNGWSKLIWNGQTVYAISSYLVLKGDATGEFTPVDEQVTAKVETNLRTAPSTTDSEVVYLLRNGEYIRRTGVRSDGWSRLIYDGQTVYAVTDYLTAERG